MTTNQSYEPTSEAITPVEYGGLQRAFDHLNSALFGSTLPDCLLTLQRRANSGGHFAPDRFSERGGDARRHEMNLNPDGFVGRTDEFIVSILLHEQVHLWQHAFGSDRPKRRGYHNKEWAAKMIALGLMPSSTGMVGGRITGSRMAHYVLDDGPFAKAFAELAASGWKLNLESTKVLGTPRGRESKVKFTCPDCAQNVWGKPDTFVLCGPCHEMTGRLIRMISAQPELVTDQTRLVA